MMVPATNRQRVRRLRRCVAALYEAAGGGSPNGLDVTQWIEDPRDAREAQIAIQMAHQGHLGPANGNGES